MKKNHYVFPVVFEQAENNVSFYFPDFPGVVGTHADLEGGIHRAKDLLGFTLSQYQEEGKGISLSI